MKTFITLLLALMITGCETASFDKYTQKVWSCTGSSVDKLVTEWGVPSRSYKTPEGNMILEYDYSGSSVYMPVGRTIAQGQFWCKTTFIADKNNIVQHESVEGNACKSE